MCKPVRRYNQEYSRTILLENTSQIGRILGLNMFLSDERNARHTRRRPETTMITESGYTFYLDFADMLTTGKNIPVALKFFMVARKRIPLRLNEISGRVRSRLHPIISPL